MKKPLKVTLFLLAFPLLLASWLAWETQYHVPSGDGLWQSTSPDGRFTVTGYLTTGLRAFLPTAPGDGSFGSGVVVLRDTQTGEILQKARTDAVSQNRAEWESDNVYIKFIGDWPLPPANPTP
jgi:hypothetical protein